MWRALRDWWTIQRIKRMRRRMSPELWERTWLLYELGKRRERSCGKRLSDSAASR